MGIIISLWVFLVLAGFTLVWGVLLLREEWRRERRDDIELAAMREQVRRRDG